MFRKNYLPKMNVYQTHDGKWIAHTGDGGAFGHRGFVQYRTGEYGESCFRETTRFDTLDELMMAIYEYAYQEHIKVIKDQIMTSKLKVRL